MEGSIVRRAACTRVRGAARCLYAASTQVRHTPGRRQVISTLKYQLPTSSIMRLTPILFIIKIFKYYEYAIYAQVGILFFQKFNLIQIPLSFLEIKISNTGSQFE